MSCLGLSIEVKNVGVELETSIPTPMTMCACAQRPTLYFCAIPQNDLCVCVENVSGFMSVTTGIVCGSDLGGYFLFVAEGVVTVQEGYVQVSENLN